MIVRVVTQTKVNWDNLSKTWGCLKIQRWIMIFPSKTSPNWVPHSEKNPNIYRGGGTFKPCHERGYAQLLDHIELEAFREPAGHLRFRRVSLGQPGIVVR
jgi:hypothetical protein